MHLTYAKNEFFRKLVSEFLLVMGARYLMTVIQTLIYFFYNIPRILRGIFEDGEFLRVAEIHRMLIALGVHTTECRRSLLTSQYW